MRKMRIWIGILAIALASIGLAGEELAEYTITKKNAKVLDQLIQAARKDDARTMAGLIRYPLHRSYPVPPVRNANEMVQRFHHVFDRALISKIASSSVYENWHPVGWRGIMLNQGDVWADYDGYVFVINYVSELESRLQKHLILLEKQKLHPSLRDYEEPVLIARDNGRVIRIDLNKSGYRYAAWPAGSKQSQKPELIIEGGSIDVQGTMRYHTYEFKSGSYSYAFEVDDAQLLVFQEDAEILKSKMRMVQPFKYVSGKFKEKFGNYQLTNF